MKYLVVRTNASVGGEKMIIGKRATCGEKAEPFDARSSAEAAIKRQMKQDAELCPEFNISYQITEAGRE